MQFDDWERCDRVLSNMTWMLVGMCWYAPYPWYLASACVAISLVRLTVALKLLRFFK